MDGSNERKHLSWLMMATCHWSFNEKQSTVVFFIKVFSSICRCTCSFTLIASMHAFVPGRDPAPAAASTLLLLKGDKSCEIVIAAVKRSGVGWVCSSPHLRLEVK